MNMNLKQTIRRILREESEYGGGIFYHNSDYDIELFKPQLRNRKKHSYLLKWFEKHMNIKTDEIMTFDSNSYIY